MRSGIHESRFFLGNFHASRSSFSPYHASRINPLPPSSNHAHKKDENLDKPQLTLSLLSFQWYLYSHRVFGKTVTGWTDFPPGWFFLSGRCFAYFKHT